MHKRVRGDNLSVLLCDREGNIDHPSHDGSTPARQLRYGSVITCFCPRNSDEDYTRGVPFRPHFGSLSAPLDQVTNANSFYT